MVDFPFRPAATNLEVALQHEHVPLTQLGRDARKSEAAHAGTDNNRVIYRRKSWHFGVSILLEDNHSADLLADLARQSGTAKAFRVSHIRCLEDRACVQDDALGGRPE